MMDSIYLPLWHGLICSLKIVSINIVLYATVNFTYLALKVI